MNRRVYLAFTLMINILAACTLGSEPAPILVYLPTVTATPTHTPSPTVTPTSTATRRPTPTGTVTLTPEPWLEIELSIVDAETGEPVTGDVYLRLVADDKNLGYLVQEQVSTTTFKLARGVTRADILFINVIAEGYTNRWVRLPPEAKTEKGLTVEAQMQKLNPR